MVIKIVVYSFIINLIAIFARKFKNSSFSTAMSRKGGIFRCN